MQMGTQWGWCKEREGRLQQEYNKNCAGRTASLYMCVMQKATLQSLRLVAMGLRQFCQEFKPKMTHLGLCLCLQLRLKSSGYGWLEENCKHFPKTIKTLKSIDQSFTSVKFSSILPGTHIRPHTGPTNERLRIHLTLEHKGGARIRVHDEWHTWPEGQAIIFDDSWEHEVLNEGQHERTVLILDIWHPELPEDKRIVH